MPILRAKNLLHRFLEVAAFEYRLISADLWTNGADPKVIARYERAVKVRAELERNTSLTSEQSELCFAELLKDEAAFRSGGVRLSLWEKFEVTRWRMSDSASPTTSILRMHYDNSPHLGTTLQFETIDQFVYVKNLFKQHGLCNLNEKHLRLVKGTSESPNS